MTRFFLNIVCMAVTLVDLALVNLIFMMLGSVLNPINVQMVISSRA